MRAAIITCLTTIALIASLGPVAWLLSAAFKPSGEIAAAPDTLISAHPTIDNLRRALQETGFVDGLWASISVAVPVTVVAVALGCATSLLTTRSRIRGRGIIDRLSLAAYVMPPVLIALPLFLLFSHFKCIGTLWALALAHLVYLFPLSWWLIAARTRELPRYSEDVVILDGGEIADLIRWVWWPSMRIHLLSVSILVFTISMNDYVLARFLMGGGRRTLPLVLQEIFDLSSKDWGLICGTGSLAVAFLSIPLLALALATGQFHSGGRRG